MKYWVMTTCARARGAHTAAFSAEEEAVEYVKASLASEKRSEKEDMGRTEGQLIESHDPDWHYVSLEVCYDDIANDLVEWRIIERMEGYDAPCSLKTLTATGGRGDNVYTVTRVFAVPSERFDLMGAIRSAAKEFYASPESEKIRKRFGDHDLKFMDFDAFVPDWACERYGFRKIKADMALDIRFTDVLVKSRDVRNGKEG